MNQMLKINNQDIQVKEFNGQRVVTFKDVDTLHERVEGTAKRNFSENKGHFIEGADYFHLSFEESRSTNFVHRPNSQGLTLLTESGYLMLVKSFTDDLAWKVQRELVNSYFRSAERKLSPMDQLRLQYEVIEQHEEKLSEFDSRLTKVESNTTIDYSQQEELRTLGTKKVVAILGGSDAPAYKELNKKVFSSFWRDYKRKLNVNSYKNTLVKDFEIGRQAIINWQPSKEVAFMIKGCNAQIKM